MKNLFIFIYSFYVLIANAENQCVGFYGLSSPKILTQKILIELKSKSSHDFQKVVSFRTKNGKNLIVVEGGFAENFDVNRVKQRFISVFDADTMEQVGKTIKSAPRKHKNLISWMYTLNVSEGPNGQLMFLINNYNSKIYYILNESSIKEVDYRNRSPHIFSGSFFDYQVLPEYNLLVKRGTQANPKSNTQTIEVFEALSPEESRFKKVNVPLTGNDFDTSAGRDPKTGNVFASVVLRNPEGTISSIVYDQQGKEVFHFKNEGYERFHPRPTNFVTEGNELIAVMRFVSSTDRSDYYNETEIRYNLDKNQETRSNQIIFIESGRSD